MATALAGISIVVIALIDSRVEANLAFSFLYLFPVVLIAGVLPRWQVVLTALICTCLADYFDPFPFTLNQGLPQDNWFHIYVRIGAAGVRGHAPAEA